MKIVILGAGASYDSINRHHEHGSNKVMKWRPPLGNDIFGPRLNFREIYNKYPGSSSLSHSISASSDIENYFQQKWDLAIKHNDKYILANIVNTQYCLQELFYTISQNYSNDIGSSNYHNLVHQAYDYHLATGEEVVFITFNYDLLLEYAVLNFFSEEREITKDLYTKYPIKIFKPHGSCNWFRVSYQYSKDKLMEEKPSLQDIQNNLEEGIIVSEHPLKKIQTSSGNNAIFRYGQDRSNANKMMHCFPQILIPMKSKDEFVMSKDHVSSMGEYLSKCTDMLIIGWKGQEEFFLETLKEKCGDNLINATFVTCGDPTPSNEVKRRIKRLRPSFFELDYAEMTNSGGKSSMKPIHSKGTFSSYILNVTKKGYKSFF